MSSMAEQHGPHTMSTGFLQTLPQGAPGPNAGISPLDLGEEVVDMLSELGHLLRGCGLKSLRAREEAAAIL